MDSARESSLHAAIREDDDEAVADLISKGADVNEINNSDETPLHQAVRTKNGKILRLLLKAGADLNARNSLGVTPLFSAVVMGDVASSKLLIEAGADVRVVDNRNETLLTKALKSGQSGILRLLADAGVNINRRTHDNSTRFHNAAEQGDIEFFKLLLDSGIDVNVENARGETPLDVAVLSPFNNFRAVKLLLRAGADVNGTDRLGNTHFERLINIAPDLYEQSRIREKLRLVLDHTDVNLVRPSGENVLGYLLTDVLVRDFQHYYKIIIEHVAKLIALNPQQVDQLLIETINGNDDHSEYFKKCEKELEKAKETKLRECSVTLFDLLVHGEQKLVKFAGNRDLIEDFGKTDLKKNFPIYGCQIRKNMEEGINGRELFDNSANKLSDQLPCFSSTHLIIRDILFTLAIDDWKKYIN